MKDNYDFSRGVKNPHADKLKEGYTVTVHYDFTDRNGQKESMQGKENAEKDVPQKQA